MQLQFRGLTEQWPGPAWQAVFDHGWPGWRDWFLSRGGRDGAGLPETRRALRRHMPEFEGLWDELVGVVRGDDDAALFLSFWTPPRYLVSCSQLVLCDDAGPMLVRNYDLDPRLNESCMLHTAWRGRRVMGMVEGLAGLADGMNDAGVAASLTFGGRAQSGRGFGIPLIMRYLLEMCRDVADAREVLRAVPCHMSYNVTIADRAGDWATVFLAPDRPPILSDRPLATNHQLGVEWPRHGRETRTRMRETHLRKMLDRPERLTGEGAIRSFLSPPLFATDYARGFGTVYTAAYRPATGEARLHWKGGAPLGWSIDDFRPASASVTYSARGSVATATGPCADARAAPSRPARDPSATGFMSQLSACLAGRQDWAALGRFWTPTSDPALPYGDVS